MGASPGGPAGGTETWQSVSSLLPAAGLATWGMPHPDLQAGGAPSESLSSSGVNWKQYEPEEARDLYLNPGSAHLVPGKY